MARWPGKLPVGVVDDRPTLTLDLTASILAAAGCEYRSDRPPDGVDVLGDIASGKPPEPRTLFWRARRADRTWKAVRKDQLKYIWRTDDGRLDEYLFDLSKDPGESNNLLGSHGEQAALLKRELAEWEVAVKLSPVAEHSGLAPPMR
ncbi:MAG: hypothetical protein O2856_01620 [Planctomycetota bacterium]|nr:hypothetical protein [Planctomycetota bacterium]